MRSQVKGRNYVIQEDSASLPYKLNKARLDKALAKLKRLSAQMSETIEDIYDADYGTYAFIRDKVFSSPAWECDDGKCYRIQEIVNEIEYIQEQLQSNDEIIPEEQIICLEDLGYKHVLSAPIWEKVLENNDVQEVVDEVQLIGNDKVLHRTRTTLWDISPGCKSSREIIYKKAYVGKRLQAAARNSFYLYQQARQKRGGNTW